VATVANVTETPAPTARRRPAAWWLERAAALPVALLLLRSSFAHLGNPYQFLSIVYSYQLVGMEAGKWVAVLVPFVQLTLAVALLFRWSPREAHLLAILTFATFAAVQASVMQRGLDISCGCFGASESLRVGWRTLGVAAGAALAAGAGGICAQLDRRGVPS
jgi:hypothetical protein